MTNFTKANSDIFIHSIRSLREGGEFRFRARGASMWPVIPDGATLVAKKIPADSARPGDIVVLESRGIITSHRLIKKTCGDDAVQLLTQGDSLPWMDEPFSGDDMLGVVTAVETREARIRLDSKAAALSSKLFLSVNHVKRAAARAAGLFSINVPKTPGGESGRAWRALYGWAAFLPYKILTR